MATSYEIEQITKSCGDDILIRPGTNFNEPICLRVLEDELPTIANHETMGDINWRSVDQVAVYAGTELEISDNHQSRLEFLSFLRTPEGIALYDDASALTISNAIESQRAEHPQAITALAFRANRDSSFSLEDQIDSFGARHPEEAIKDPFVRDTLIDNGALHILSYMGAEPHVLDQALANGGDPNSANDRGRTPLFYAGTPEVAQWLLDHCSDPTHKDVMGHTADASPYFASDEDDCLTDVRASIQKVIRSGAARYELDEIAQHKRVNGLLNHATTQAIIRTDRDGSTELMDGATLHTAANLADGGHDTAQAPYWLAQRGQEPTPITGAADPLLRPHVAVDERVAVYDQEIAVASTPATLSPGHRQEELASAQQVQAKRKAYGRAM